MMEQMRTIRDEKTQRLMRMPSLRTDGSQFAIAAALGVTCSAVDDSGVHKLTYSCMYVY